MKKLIKKLSLVLAPVVVCSLAIIHLHAAQPQDQPGPDENKMMDQCRQIMNMRQKMRAEMNAQDKELRKLLDQMNSAPPDQKVEAMAAVVNKLATQRLAMHQRIQSMQGRMMQHMMRHMQMGRGSMPECPMMRGPRGGGPADQDDNDDSDEDSE